MHGTKKQGNWIQVYKSSNLPDPLPHATQTGRWLLFPNPRRGDLFTKNGKTIKHQIQGHSKWGQRDAKLKVKGITCKSTTNGKYCTISWIQDSSGRGFTMQKLNSSWKRYTVSIERYALPNPQKKKTARPLPSHL